MEAACNSQSFYTALSAAFVDSSGACHLHLPFPTACLVPMLACHLSCLVAGWTRGANQFQVLQFTDLFHGTAA